MRLMIKIFLMLIFFSSTLFSKIEVNSINDNSIDLSFVNYKSKAKLAVVLSDKPIVVNYSEKLESLDKEKISINKGIQLSDGKTLVYYSEGLKKLKIYDLKEASRYYLKVISFDKKLELDSLEFYTLSKEPTIQAKYLIFKNTKHNELTLLFKKGNGKKRVVFVSLKEKMSLPKDGKNYKANSNFGDFESAVGAETYCVYNGEGNEIKITGFKPETKYYFRVFEYNGNNQTINYLLKEEDQNPRSKIMPLPPPKALPAINITSDGFIAKWKKVDGAKYYEIDVSEDKNFGTYLELYEHMDIGDIDEIEIVDLKPGDYYYRIKAVGKYSRSPYSNIIKVTIKEKDEKSKK